MLHHRATVNNRPPLFRHGPRIVRRVAHPNKNYAAAAGAKPPMAISLKHRAVQATHRMPLFAKRCEGIPGNAGPRQSTFGGSVRRATPAIVAPIHIGQGIIYREAWCTGLVTVGRDAVRANEVAYVVGGGPAHWANLWARILVISETINDTQAEALAEARMRSDGGTASLRARFRGWSAPMDG